MNALLDLAKGYNSNSNACISLIAQLVKNPPPMQETLVQFLGQEDPLEKGGFVLLISKETFMSQLGKF